MRSKSIFLVLTIFVLTGVLSMSACRTPAGRTSGEVMDDSTISTKIKAKLVGENVLQGLAIDVDTFEGEVTLTGAVESESQKERAGEIAWSVYGVKGVNNLLKIKKK